MTEDQVHEYAGQLRMFANHFVDRDWDYTREHKIRRLYVETFRTRLWDAVKWAARDAKRRLLRRKTSLDRLLKVSWWGMARAHWRYHNHLPDGVLDGGNVIVQWEETGEYLQYVQPSVGSLLADLVDSHADLPLVQGLAAEMKRINDRYGERIDAESVS